MGTLIDLFKTRNKKGLVRRDSEPTL